MRTGRQMAARATCGSQRGEEPCGGEGWLLAAKAALAGGTTLGEGLQLTGHSLSRVVIRCSLGSSLAEDWAAPGERTW